MLVNRVKAPTKNRHFVASADAITGVAPNAGEYNITTADVLDVDVVDSIATYMDQIECPAAREVRGRRGRRGFADPRPAVLAGPVQQLRQAGEVP
ncbi:DUF4043 family protein [Pseudomonas aeruginosa]|nr:DUF4043 family protein [Pseudomonas aeruginosa]MCT2416067.1 DUF4043 family protein [Pseudomonas aeruginosa]